MDDPAEDDWLGDGLGALSWAVTTLGRSLTGLALALAAAVITAWGVHTGNPLGVLLAGVTLTYAVAVLTIQSRDAYTGEATPLPALLRDALSTVPTLVGIVVLCLYAIVVVSVLGLGLLSLFAVAVFILGLELAVLVLVPLAVHLLARLAVAVPTAVLDGAGPLAALEEGVETAPRALPRLFALLVVVAAIALPVSVLSDTVSSLLGAVIAGALSALTVTATTRVYLDVRDDESVWRVPRLSGVLRNRLGR